MPGLLALLAHPDDEFFCAGLLAALTARGVPVHLVYWTRGEGGGSPRRRAFLRCIPRAFHPRVREARRAAAVLRASSVGFLGSVDPAPNPESRAPDDDVKSFQKKINPLLEKYRPELLVTHGSEGDYGHPAHLKLHQITRGLALPCPWISFNADWPGAPDAVFLNRRDRADFLLDTQPFSREKTEVIRAHRSQRPAFEAMAQKQGGSVGELLQLSRHEGYHCWNTGDLRNSALARLSQWATEGKSF
jgi:LmbE family N-acetylglucosaminyl deacetylase